MKRKEKKLLKGQSVEEKRWNPNDATDVFIRDFLLNPSVRRAYIRAAQKAGDTPGHIRDVLEYFDCYQ